MRGFGIYRHAALVKAVQGLWIAQRPHLRTQNYQDTRATNKEGMLQTCAWLAEPRCVPQLKVRTFGTGKRETTKICPKFTHLKGE